MRSTRRAVPAKGACPLFRPGDRHRLVPQHEAGRRRARRPLGRTGERLGRPRLSPPRIVDVPAGRGLPSTVGPGRPGGRSPVARGRRGRPGNLQEARISALLPRRDLEEGLARIVHRRVGQGRASFWWGCANRSIVVQRFVAQQAELPRPKPHQDLGLLDPPYIW